MKVLFRIPLLALLSGLALSSETELFDLSNPHRSKKYRNLGILAQRDLVVKSQSWSSFPSSSFSCDTGTERGRKKPALWPYRKRGRSETQFSWESVVIGLMVRSLESVTRSDKLLLKAAKHTWMKETNFEIDVLLFTDCRTQSDIAVERIPRELHNAAIKWKCYFPKYNITSASIESIAVKANYDKCARLYSVMHIEFPNKKWYIKIDTDTVLIPKNLMKLLTFLNLNVHNSSKLLIGDSGEPPQRSSLPEDWLMNRLSHTSKDAVFKRFEWKQLVKERYPGQEVVSLTSTVTHVQGGFIALSAAMLHSIATDDCVTRVGSMPCDRRKKKHCINQPEDVAIGLCAHLHHATLLDCSSCLRNIVGTPTVEWVNKTANQIGKPGSTTCRTPITAHPVKNSHAYSMVFNILSNV